MVITLARETILTALMLAAPPLLMGLVVGLIISIFQAVTQIQEQTLTFVPKLIAVLVSLVIFGAWMLNILMGFTERILGNLSSVIH
jgi:flagellar biosynthesis protein FliQ